MGVKALLKNGLILGIGYMNFQPQGGESVVDLGDIVIPEDAALKYTIVNGSLTLRQVPLTRDEYGDATQSAGVRKAKILAQVQDLLSQKLALEALGQPATDIQMLIDALKEKYSGI